MAKKRYYSKSMNPGPYAGLDERRRQEVDDAGMIPFDRKSIANLPQEVIYREWPKEAGYLPENLRDGIGSVDEQMNQDHRDMMKNFKPKKV